MTEYNTNQNNNTYKALVILLLITNIVFIWLYFNKTSALTDTKEELVSSESAKTSLDSLLNINKNELNQYKGLNATLDAMLDQKNKEVEMQAKKIEDLIRSGQISVSQLKKAQEELEVLRYYTQKYARQVDSFARANDILVVVNDSLKQDLRTSRDNIERLQQSNSTLQVKADVASRLKAQNFVVTGLQKKNTSGYRETLRAKRTDALKVKFRLAENLVADKKESDFYLRIIDTEGQTISDKISGGIFTFQGEEFKYTQRQTILFNNSSQEVNYVYAQELPWKEGTYKIEIYNDGFLIGVTEIQLN